MRRGRRSAAGCPRWRWRDSSQRRRCRGRITCRRLDSRGMPRR
ncbi:hypothetical protein B8V81_4671 [Paenibacillus pasadenensis]|uniref:Uncharacterized protein n=1 Tax=Paenibacillus pasadenensis TaxID=217090 RepID=A0A2N5N7G6_9BACL|nr:hypothetical protein B8V81_4671 [Paenibacillus pasadenensis]